jgi:uncharacterized protein with PIN domain/molybdopterin converting factor small subunit
VTRLFLRFYQELNDFLPPGRRQREFEHRLNGRASVKDTIEALGVPHTEVDLILVNGQSVGFDRLLQEGDRVSVFPRFESIDISPVVHLRPAPLRHPRFVLDGHLGRLTAYLRLFGFDCLYNVDWDDDLLARVSAQDERLLLTRDRGLLKRKAVTRGYCPRETHPRQQLVEVLRRFDLLGVSHPLTRCMVCNGLLERVGKEQVLQELPPAVAGEQEEFHRCKGCSRVYWRGTHHARLTALIEAVRLELGKDEGFRSL